MDETPAAETPPATSEMASAGKIKRDDNQALVEPTAVSQRTPDVIEDDEYHSLAEPRGTSQPSTTPVTSRDSEVNITADIETSIVSITPGDVFTNTKHQIQSISSDIYVPVNTGIPEEAVIAEEASVGGTTGMSGAYGTETEDPVAVD